MRRKKIDYAVNPYNQYIEVIRLGRSLINKSVGTVENGDKAIEKLLKDSLKNCKVCKGIGVLDPDVFDYYGEDNVRCWACNGMGVICCSCNNPEFRCLCVKYYE